MASLNSQFSFHLLQNMIGKSHPALYAVIEEFQKEEEDTAAMMKEQDGGKKIRQATHKNIRIITCAATSKQLSRVQTGGAIAATWRPAAIMSGCRGRLCV